MLEKKIEQKVSLYAKNNNFLSYKFTSPSNKSVPDRLFISPKGEIFFIEFKRKGKFPTKLQGKTFKKLSSRGVAINIIDDYKEGINLINNYKED